MSSPHIPATTMVAKATTLAFTGGRAVGPLAGSRGPSFVDPAPGSGTRRS